MDLRYEEVGRAILHHAEKGAVMREAVEQVTVYRNEKGEIAGLILEEEYRGKPVFTCYKATNDGFRWLNQGEREQVTGDARERFFFHTHHCPVCWCEVECDRGYECADQQKDVRCEECAERQHTDGARRHRLFVVTRPEQQSTK